MALPGVGTDCMASLICTYIVATAKVRLLHVDRLKREIKMPYMHDMHMLSMIKFSRVLHALRVL